MKVMDKFKIGNICFFVLSMNVIDFVWEVYLFVMIEYNEMVVCFGYVLLVFVFSLFF